MHDEVANLKKKNFNLKNILDKHKNHDIKKVFRMIAVLSELENLRE